MSSTQWQVYWIVPTHSTVHNMTLDHFINHANRYKKVWMFRTKQLCVKWGCYFKTYNSHVKKEEWWDKKEQFLLGIPPTIWWCFMKKFMEKCESLIKCSDVILLYGSSVAQVKPFIFYLCSYDFAKNDQVLLEFDLLFLSKQGFGGLKLQPFKIGSIVSSLKKCHHCCCRQTGKVFEKTVRTPPHFIHVFCLFTHHAI